MTRDKPAKARLSPRRRQRPSKKRADNSSLRSHVRKRA
jgi:hypothetical protein